MALSDSPAGRHEAAIELLKRTAAEISAACLSNVLNLDDWNRERPGLLRELRPMLGLDLLPERTPLEAQVTGTLDRPEYRIEKVVFQSSPGLYVTANLYLPTTERRTPLPGLVYACGHSPHPLGAKALYQDRAIRFALEGYACLILDTLEFGEVAGIHHGIHDLNMWKWLSLGYTPIGVEVWNAMRAIDYLQMRPEVDSNRIGMTGISGGGAATWYTAALDERVKAAVPVCSAYTFGSQAAHWVAAGQCDCIYFHNTFLRDFPVVAALIAPRPLLFCNGQKDFDFPPDGYHEVYRRARRIYELLGCPERIVEVDAAVGHEDAPQFRDGAVRWMNRWLTDHPVPPRQIAAPPLVERAEDLACLPAMPPDAASFRIHDEFVPTAPLQRFSSVTEWDTRRRELLGALREQVFRWFPEETVPFETMATENDGGWAARYAAYKEFLFDSESASPVRVQLLTPPEADPDAPVLIYAKRAGDSIYFLDLDELLPLMGRCTILILNPRFTEHPITPREYADIERTASWVGRTIAGMQVWDILRAVEWARSEVTFAAGAISLYGKREMGIAALYAGLMDDRIQQVIFGDPPDSHWRGPALLNVLRVTDTPEAAGAFAPRRLTFIREMPHGFAQARDLYRLQGCEDRFRIAGSLPEALEIWERVRTG